MRTITIGIELAKSVFPVCELDGNGRVSQRSEPFIQWLAQVPAGTVVAMGACSSARHWGRRCLDACLQPRLMAAQFVSPFRKRQAAKNGRNDAEAIAIAASHNSMRFVPVKSIEQQARLAEHRIREGYKVEGLVISNRLHSVLAEFGVAIPQGDAALRRTLATLWELPVPARLQVLLRDLEQHSCGGKARPGRITRRGDSYLRTLLIQGGRSSLQRAQAVSRERATPAKPGRCGYAGRTTIPTPGSSTRWCSGRRASGGAATT